MGKIASLSLEPSAFGYDTDGAPALVNDRTYADDGQLILRLWVVSLIFVVAQCCLGCYAVAPPTQEKLRKWNVNFIEEENVVSVHH